MKYTEFSMKTKKDHIPAPWEKDMEPSDFVSYLPSYTGGKYRCLFEKRIYKNDVVGNITYYVYDPTKHGAAKTKKYPMLVFLHGASNALDGEICITHCGGEMYASPEYQERMGGGAFIVVPLANEKLLEDGNIVGGWSPEYAAPVKGIMDLLCKEHQDCVGKKIVLGGSSGGYFSWKLAEDYAEDIDGCIPISSGYVPDEKGLARIEACGVHVLVAHGRHDELAPFEECIAPFEKRLQSMKDCICYFPEWVRNGDGGVASLNFGFEMGQHCLINQVQANLLYVDGSCYDERIPEGITGWVKAL